MRAFRIAAMLLASVPAVLLAQEGQDELEQLPRLKASPIHYYPKNARKRPGRVVLQFVVDSTGRAESGSMTVLSATDSTFVEAAKLTILAAVFEPGRAKGHPVATFVNLGVNFKPGQQKCAFVVTPLLDPQCVDSTAKAGG
jgi:TonB family protein